MRREIQVLLVIGWAVFVAAISAAAHGASPRGELAIFPESILLTLSKSPGQEYQVSSTLNPMKIIVDSSLPLVGFEAVQPIEDVVLRQLRYSVNKQGAARLVLEFKYRVPEPEVTEDADFLHLAIAKTYVQTSRRTVDPGVVYGHQRRADVFGPNVVNYLEIDLWREIEVKLGLAKNGVFGAEHVSTISERLGGIAAVNGAFFASNGRPLGLLMIDGELVGESYANRTALGLGQNVAVMDNVSFQGQVLGGDGLPFLAVSGLNRPRLEDELIVYTPHYGTKTNTNSFGCEVTVVDDIVRRLDVGNSSIPPDGFVLSAHGLKRQFLLELQIGDQLSLDFELQPDWSGRGVEQIIGGGPRLVKDGELWVTGEAERFQEDITVGRAPRTALGITPDHKLLLVTVNGRQPDISVGMTLSELGYLLIELGAVQAMNLDGGGSTTMVIRDLVLNLPSEGKERPVSNAIVVITDPK